MKWLGGVMLVLLSLTGNAQKTVFQNLTWEQAAELAQKENKIILVDAMREPATPEARKQKDKEEAVWQKVAANLEFCKQHVVAIRIDMASEAGKEFAPKLVMNMYPTYGFFMPNGDILGTVSPFLLAKNPELFLERGKKAWEQAEVKRNNKRSIVFEEIGLKEALEKAKKENKLVFIDAYTAWCQPCVMMGKNVFTLDKVADFYNRNFINLKIDFGKEKELSEKYVPERKRQTGSCGRWLYGSRCFHRLWAGGIEKSGRHCLLQRDLATGFGTGPERKQTDFHGLLYLLVRTLQDVGERGIYRSGGGCFL